MDFSYRKATSSDIPLLESIRIRSIQSCAIYSEDQRGVWAQSIPDWPAIIDNTLICTKNDQLLGFAVANERELDLLYVAPNFHGLGIAYSLVSRVERPGMKCDCNPYSEKVLKRRGWKFESDNVKTKDGQTFHNRWYVFHSNE